MKKTCLFACILAVSTIIIVWTWFYPAEKCSQVDLIWTDDGTPIVESTIDGKKCLLDLSTCGRFSVSLNERGLEQLEDQTSKGTLSWGDRRGNCYESPSYLIKTFSIGPLTLSDIVAPCKAEQPDMLWENPKYDKSRAKPVSGAIGRPILLMTNLLLDLGHNRIILTNSKKDLKKFGIVLDNMKKFSLEPEERGTILRADTEIGPMRLDINTGATVSLVRSSLFNQMPNMAKKLQKDWRGLSYFVTNVLVDSTALGWQKMYPVDIREDIEWADGCLGVDFLNEHIVYIDYPNKKVYIS